MKIESKLISELQPAQYNPRQISKTQFSQLKESVAKFGLVDPIIINQNGNIVVGGHQRLKVAKELNHKEIECVVLNLTPEEERELNIRLNKSGGDWDFDLLSNFEIEELKDWGFKEIELGLNIDKIEEKKPNGWIVSMRIDNVLEAEKIHLELKEQGHNPTLKKSV